MIRRLLPFAAACAAAATALTAGPPAVADVDVRPLLVAHRQSADVSTMAVTRDGAVSLLASGVPTGAGTRAIVVTPDGRYAFAASRESNEIWSYSVARDGTLTVVSVIKGQDNFPYGIVMSPNGRTVYVGNQGTDVVSAYAIGPGGTLTARGPAIKSGALHTRIMSMTPDGRFLYVGHGDSTPRHPGVLTGFAVNPNGTLTPHVGPISVGIAAGTPAMTPDGRFLYVPGEESNELYGFAIAGDGTLTAVPGSPYPAVGEHQGGTVTPDGRHLYLTDISGDVIRGWNVDAADGSLETIPGSPFPSGDLPIGVTPSPDGRFLYVASFNSHDVRAYTIGDRGELAAAGAPVLTGGMSPATRSTAFIPNKGPRARFTAMPPRFDATGSTDRDGRVTRYDWNFGDGTVRRNAGPTPTHVYRNPGTYTVTLTVTDDEGCSTHLVYIGHIALCTGSDAATFTRHVVVTD